MNKIFLIILICYPLISNAQDNLLINGDLQKHDKHGGIYYWSICSGTPDLYLGKKHTVFCLFMDAEFATEAMQGKLNRNLDSNTYYKIEADVKADNKWCKTFINEISICFSKDSLKRNKGLAEIKLKKMPYASLFTEDSSIIGSQTYTHVRGIYHALGGEQYVIIGNIYPANSKIYLKESQRHSMYYYDNIKVTQMLDINNESVEKKKELVLYFEQGSYVLNKENLLILNSWLTGVLHSKIKKIEIFGYASSEGTEALNQTLSAKRAGEIKVYLIDKQIDESLITNKTMGVISKQEKDEKDRKVLIKAIIN